MKRILITALLAVYSLFVCLGQENSKQWLNLNYAGDNQEYHNLDIYLPETGKSAYKPIIVIYGSAWFGNNFKQHAYNTYGKSLLESGFAVIAINHRSSADAVYPAQINDVKAAIRFVRANADKYNIDASFIGITGYSSGGHLASLAGTTNRVKEYTVNNTTVDIEGKIGDYTSYSSSVNAVVDWFGPIDLARMDNCNGPKEGDSPEAALIRGNPADNLDMIALTNPITYIDERDPNFLVIHGDADNVVPHCQSELFSKALKEKGLLTEFISVPEGQHGPVTFNDSTFKKMTDFFLKEAERASLTAQGGRAWSRNNQAVELDTIRSYENYFTKTANTIMTPDEEGFIRRWTLLEPIEVPVLSNTIFTDSYLRNAFDTIYFENQFTILPIDGEKVKVGEQQLTWHALDSKLFNTKLFRFAYGLHKPIYGVLFWAVTVINSPEEMKDVRMSVGSNSASMWWLNGEEVLLLSGDRRMVMDDAVSPRLTLNKGKNIIRGAVINGPGMSDFCVRFLDEQGKPIKNIHISNN
ncbi:MAG: alpha/beta hydrolase [Fermentimonas sp.]|nr:alpha/beta hydrolase [Fermentimonas sp.]